jgi:hypothetical protein
LGFGVWGSEFEVLSSEFWILSSASVLMLQHFEEDLEIETFLGKTRKLANAKLGVDAKTPRRENRISRARSFRLGLVDLVRLSAMFQNGTRIDFRV